MSVVRKNYHCDLWWHHVFIFLCNDEDFFIKTCSLTSAIDRFVILWWSKEVKDSAKVKFMKTLVTAVALCGCEAWTLSKQLEKKIFAVERRCFCRLHGIQWRDHRTNASVLEEVRKKEDRGINVRRNNSSTTRVIPSILCAIYSLFV